jgi:hypothetical protein
MCSRMFAQVGSVVPVSSSPYFAAVAAGTGFDLVVAWADFENETSWVVYVNATEVSGTNSVAMVQLTVTNVGECKQRSIRGEGVEDW